MAQAYRPTGSLNIERLSHLHCHPFGLPFKTAAFT
jgi:hypothetical protein